MKRWAWILCAILAAHFLGAEGQNLEQLKPVQLLSLRQEGDLLVLETDTGDWGTGETLEKALQNLQSGAEGRVFLQTTEILLVQKGTEALIPGLGESLRPAAGVCVSEFRPDPQQAAGFLSYHRPEVSLQQVLYENRVPQELRLKKGRWHLGKGSK